MAWKFLLAAVVLAIGVSDVEAQRKPAGGGRATLAVVVSDAEGAPIPGVLVSVEGGVTRSARTEAGRIVFEDLPPGAYRLRFDRDGFVPLERELTARGGAPTDVKVTLNPLPAPPPPPEEPAKPKAVDARPVTLDLLAVIDKEFVGRAASRITQLSCGGDVLSTLIQLNQPLAQHAHENADEVFYVIAGEGSALYGGVQQRLKAGVYVFVPRGLQHSLTQTGRNPLIVLSTRTGEPCQGSVAQ